jgi:hypothetical protein
MHSAPFSRARHLSIVWVITLAIVTTVEWRSLEREPLKPELMLPFIERQVSISAAPEAGGTLTQTVEIGFNGPLFLLYCFGPVLGLYAISWIARRVGRGRGGS